MKCPWCFVAGENKVLPHTRKIKETEDRGTIVRRKRRCLKCGKDFFTIEYVRELGDGHDIRERR